MEALNRRTPAGRPGLRGGLQAGQRDRLHAHSILSRAAVKAMETELFIVLAAADRMAGGHSLAWSDYDRLHQAHQHLVRILGEQRGVEVLT